jgi:hypothetical protein
MQLSTRYVCHASGAIRLSPIAALFGKSFDDYALWLCVKTFKTKTRWEYKPIYSRLLVAKWKLFVDKPPYGDIKWRKFEIYRLSF